jgi:hypothetical protein
MESKRIDIIDPKLRSDLYRANAGIVAGQPWDIGPVAAGELSAELDFDLIRHVMEGTPGDD